MCNVYILYVICNLEAGEVVISHVTIVECTPKHQFKWDPPSRSELECCVFPAPFLLSAMWKAYTNPGHFLSNPLYPNTL